MNTARPPQELLQKSVRKRQENLNFTPEVLRAINCYRRPGNMLGLQNVQSGQFIMADSRRITGNDWNLFRKLRFPLP